MNTRMLPCLSVAVFLCTATAYAKQEQDVNVVNTPTVNVGNAVTIDNSDLPVHIVDQPVTTQASKSPMNTFVQFTIGDSVINPGSQLMVTVPSDRRFVIESISVWTFTTVCDFFLKPSITTTAGGTTSEFRLPIPDRAYSPSGGYYTHNSTWPIKLYADPGSDINVNAIRTESGCSATVRFSVAGYLEYDE